MGAEVGLDRAPARHLEPLDPPEPRDVLGLEPQRLDDEVGGLVVIGALDRLGRLPARHVGGAEPHPRDPQAVDAAGGFDRDMSGGEGRVVAHPVARQVTAGVRHRALVGLAGDARRVAGKGVRGREPDELHPLFLGVLHLALAARHVGPVTAIEALDADGPLPDRRAHAVHRRVTAADHHHALARGVQLSILEIRHLVAQIHAVRGGQIVQRPHHPALGRVVDVEVAGLIDARRDQHRVMLAADRVKADRLAHVGAQHELDAPLFQQAVAALDHRLFQLEAGDAVDQQPARAVVAVIDRDLEPHPPQPVGGREPARPRADDADALGPLGRGADRLDPALVPGGVGDVFLDRADGDGAVAGLLDDAVALAQPVLRADAAADLGEGVGLLRAQIGFLRAALGGQAQPVGNVVMKRAVALAVGNPALAAPARLLFRLGVGELAVDLVKVLGALGSRALVGHLPRHGDELEHRLRGHRLRPLESSEAPCKAGMRG